MKIFGLIPARGGSKGVPRKNIRLVGGEPLIAYTIKAAKHSRRLTTFLVSTDDDEIAEVARRYGSQVLRRPPELARDDTPMVPVVLHALEHAEQESGSIFDVIVLLQPSAPIRTGADIDAVIQILEEDPSTESVISVSLMEDTHPARMYCLEEDSWMKPLNPEWETALRQELPKVYHRNGVLYALRRWLLTEQRKVIGHRKKAYVMPRERSVNIDDEVDLLLADLLVRRWKEGQL